MNTRMETVTEDVALAVLRKLAVAANPPLQPEILKEAFQARWPTPDSTTPMNDAMNAAALGSGTGWPDTMEEFDEALKNLSEEGDNLGAALGACMGRPDMLKFGFYAEAPEEVEEDGILFATTTIELANRLAGQSVA